MKPLALLLLLLLTSCVACCTSLKQNDTRTLVIIGKYPKSTWCEMEIYNQQYLPVLFTRYVYEDTKGKSIGNFCAKEKAFKIGDTLP